MHNCCDNISGSECIHWFCKKTKPVIDEVPISPTYYEQLFSYKSYKQRYFCIWRMFISYFGANNWWKAPFKMLVKLTARTERRSTIPFYSSGSSWDLEFEQFTSNRFWLKIRTGKTLLTNHPLLQKFGRMFSSFLVRCVTNKQTRN